LFGATLPSHAPPVSYGKEPSLRRRLILASATLLALIATPAIASAAEKPIYLDTYSPKRNAKFIGPVSFKNRLVAGKPYMVSVRGTWSYLSVRNEQLCGFPERRPLFPTRRKGVKNGRVVADAEFYFAQRPPFCANPARFIVPGVKFRIAVRRKFYNPKALETGRTPTPNHAYNYPVLGYGRKIRFRIPEVFPLDNYGRFRIRIREVTEADCTALGGEIFGFANVSACIAATRLVAPAPARNQRRA
jgi:hypothetical protein